MQLYNKLGREELIKRLESETFKRITISFYKYFRIVDTQVFRDNLFIQWDKLNCLGRIYVANEGINAQMSVPEHNLSQFLKELYQIPELNQVPIKYAVEDDGKSFYKLTIKAKQKIVADGLDDNEYDVTNVGRHLSAIEFHQLVDDPETLIIDMRNHYESEVGRFKKAYCPDVDTFKDAIQLVIKEFEAKKDKKILLYCTGGIRCEKASAYMKHHGFKDVNQLHGGIIEYARQLKALRLSSKFMGRNFVFDNRLGESIDGNTISHCHQCGKPCDIHTNCANDDCHLLFIQCKECKEKYEGCCSEDCCEINKMSTEEKKKIRKSQHLRYAESKIFKRRLRLRISQVV